MNACSLLVLLGLVCLVRCQAPVVKTKYGDVSGRTFTLPNGKRVSRWLGIRFAKAPTGTRRFMPPEEPDPWDEVFMANTLNDACMQPQGPNVLWLTHIGWNRYSEDCLMLNIFAPEFQEGVTYPVMFWLHGGGYTSSANIQYPGHFLAGKDVVMVVPNYRLGALGFMSTNDTVTPGNMGLLDQLLALQFVQENIAAFGGDPKRVTLFGQSAGASSSMIMTLSPKAKGLYHQVIAESGTDQAFWATNPPDAMPHTFTQQVAANLGCPTEDSQVMMDCLRAVEDPMDIIGQGITCTPGYFCQGFAPVVDGPDGVLPDKPRYLRRDGNFEKVPSMIGQTTDDGSLYTVLLIPDSINQGFNRSEFERVLRNDLLGMFLPSLPGDDEDIFQAVNWFYSPWPHVDDLDANREAFNVMITDFGFGVTGDVAIKSQAQYADVYQYVLGYRSSKAAAVVPEWLGVPHNGELPYVMAWPLLQTNLAIRLDSGIIVDLIDWDDEDMVWAEYIQTLWTNFAKFGNPTPEPVPAPDGSSTTWKTFDVQDYNYLYMDRELIDAKEYRQKNFAFLLDYMVYVSEINLWPYSDKKAGKKTPTKPLHTNDMDQRKSDLIRKILENKLKRKP